ncbi:cysteine hydrolase family protein [Rhizosphaericola mali]|uniref:Cysteine hydrolase n=1 Tax=Rhizosphaericola mali TaxID=2545455 RepID=A0A5P2G4A8_9BACT|nr:isochorismatase family cysteine hydrolase [Rhizosphaericola mali]QES87933.1 cysteine hydrolase [Rhizosphaericola mali]
MGRTALLVMDMQKMLLSTLSNPESIIEKNKQAILFARENQIPIIYVVVGFNEGFHEIHPNNKSFSKIAQNLANVDLNKWKEISEEIQPQKGDAVVVKKRFSAFTGSDLDLILRSKNIQHIVLSGIVTSGVVLSTYTEAADKDFKITILSDACKDRDEEVHQLLMSKIFTRNAEVMTVENWENTFEK